jgi:hypothetical protein
MKRNIYEKRLIDINSLDDKLQSDNKPGSKILTVQEVAVLLMIHRSTVTRLAKSGVIKSFLIDNRKLPKHKPITEKGIAYDK